MVSAHALTFSLLFLLSLANFFNSSEASLMVSQRNGDVVIDGNHKNSGEMVPLMEEKTVVMMMNETRRRLNSFQICAVCTCCGGAKGVCLPSPCCYAINCNIPNRPFGFCSFTPKTCNCLGCHL